MRFFRPLFGCTAIVAAFVLLAGAMAEARPGFGGSRGGRTFSAPPMTNTAPRSAAPIERSMTQPRRPAAPSAAASGAAANKGGFFNRPGLLGGLAAGFLGAGLFGLLAGQGLFGNMAGFASFIGLLLQIALVVIVARLAWAWWQRRNGNLAFAGSMQGAQAQNFTGAAGAMGGATAAAAAEPVGTDDVTIGPQDFDAFEEALGAIQTAYGREDLSALRELVTAEMLTYFSDDLSANSSRGVRNELSDVKLLQGNLAESWRESDVEYATLAMRFSLDDRMVDRTDGRLVEGGPTEATELWTFMRNRGGRWLLSAIQQAT